MQADTDLKNIELGLSLLKSTVELRGALSLFDINIVSEYFFRDLLNLLFDWQLENLNLSEKNSDSVDLGDDKNKVAIQVTSTVTASKVKSTVETFEKNSRQTRFPRLIVLFLSNCKNFPKMPVTKGYSLELWDLTIIYQEIAKLHVDKLSHVARLVTTQLVPALSDNSSSFNFIEKFAANAAAHIRRIASWISKKENGDGQQFELRMKELKGKFKGMKCSPSYQRHFEEHAVFFPTIVKLKDSDAFAGGGLIVGAVASLIGNIYTELLAGCSSGDEIHRKIHGRIIRNNADENEIFATEVFISYVVHECGIFNDEK